MLGNVLFWLALVLVMVALAMLTIEALRAKNAWVKWLGGSLVGLTTALLAVVNVVAAVGLVKLYVPRWQPVADLQVEGTPEQIERGAHLANAFCAECHSPTGELPLVGGVDLGETFPLPLGSFVSVNLTPGGPLKDWSDGVLLRVLREGVGPQGEPLVFKGAGRARYMSDEDLAAIIAYLRNQPPIDDPTPQPPDQPNLLGVIFVALNLVPSEPPVTGSITAPPKAPTAEYGAYLVSFQDCTVCHGPNLDGNPTGLLVAKGADLEVVKGWTADQFIATLRTGVNPAGHELSSVMPWRTIGRLDDVELSAIHAYLLTLP